MKVHLAFGVIDRSCSLQRIPQFELVPVTVEEDAEREMRGMCIHASRDTLSKETMRTSSTNMVFYGSYVRPSPRPTTDAPKPSLPSE